MTMLVIGSTGNVGRPTVEALLARDAEVRCLSRSAEKLSDLPAGAMGVVGDLESGDGLAAALDGVDRLFLITANGETETTRGLNAIKAAQIAGASRIVYLSAQDLEQEPAVPHFHSKLPIEQALKESGAAWTILRPNLFNQTDLSVAKVIMDYGVYPMPIGSKGQNRVDTRDIADAAVRALTEDGHAGAEYTLHGPDTVTGEQAAAVYSRHFGRDVKYGGDDVDAWAESVKAFLPTWLLESLKVMFLAQQANGPAASEAQVAASSEAVGHPLRSFDAFAAELAARLKG